MTACVNTRLAPRMLPKLGRWAEGLTADQWTYWKLRSRGRDGLASDGPRTIPQTPCSTTTKRFQVTGSKVTKSRSYVDFSLTVPDLQQYRGFGSTRVVTQGIYVLLLLLVVFLANATRAQALAVKPDPAPEEQGVFVGRWTYEGGSRAGPLVSWARSLASIGLR
jgi:hypothetical protein